MIKAYKKLSTDSVMQQLIKRFGELSLTTSDNLFVDLVSNIVGQQLSVKAAATIWGRVQALIGEIAPKNVLETSDEAIRQAGCSYSKIRYIKNIATVVLDNTLDISNLHSYDDEEIILQLTAIKGVGRWTAEMFLIFSLGREDVFSFGDGGLRNSINRLYSNGTILSKDEVVVLTDKWKPYRSIASLYLWKNLDNAPQVIK